MKNQKNEKTNSDRSFSLESVKVIHDAVEIELCEIPLARAISIFSRKYFVSGIRRELRDREQNPKKSDRGRLKARRALDRLRRMAKRKGSR